MQSPASPLTYFDLLAGVLGLTVGSLLNYWAVQSLRGQSVFPPGSSSASCEHRLTASEFIPLLSYILLNGRCKHCGGSISWYYPFVEAVTACLFIVILRYFGWNINGAAMLFFVSVLITVCITDFKEKLIPHEITYPVIILGIIYSSVVRHDFLSTLAGIGISYIFFDFVAFYGLKVYLFYNRPELVINYHHNISLPEPISVKAVAKKLGKKSLEKILSLEPQYQFIKRKITRLGKSDFVMPGGQSLDDFEVMGGGDAVLAALISAWLGLPKLLLALLISFLVGTALGAVYLVFEMYKQKLLGSMLRPMAFSAALGAISFIALAMILASLLQQPLASMHWLTISFLGALVGALIGVIQTGSRLSKAFPFGPALAIGALVVMF